MNIQKHLANTRGFADHDWLKSHHSFSFASYFDEERMGVGLLRVLNDDVVAPDMGFGTHPHNNMEIISIPLSGSLKHKDTMGNETIITDSEVQAMSAGTGVAHSEYNASQTDPVNFLQLWIITRQQDIKPHYSQEAFNRAQRLNSWQLIVSPNGENNSVIIHQDAFISRSELTEGNELNYEFKNLNNLVYVFIISGKVEIAQENLDTRDALVISDSSHFEVISKKQSDILVIEIPRINK